MPKKSPANNKFIWYATLAISGLYLLNIGVGIIELVPDNFPLIGNLDEAGATLLLIKSIKEIKDAK